MPCVAGLRFAGSCWCVKVQDCGDGRQQETMMRDRRNGPAVRFQDLHRNGFKVSALLEAHPAVMLMSMLLALAVFFFLPASARAFSMELPVNCSGVEFCAPQNYFDHDPSPTYSDYVCGPLSYDSHTGTDIDRKSVV